MARANVLDEQRARAEAEVRYFAWRSTAWLPAGMGPSQSTSHMEAEHPLPRRKRCIQWALGKAMLVSRVEVGKVFPAQNSGCCFYLEGILDRIFAKLKCHRLYRVLPRP